MFSYDIIVLNSQYILCIIYKTLPEDMCNEEHEQHQDDEDKYNRGHHTVYSDNKGVTSVIWCHCTVHFTHYNVTCTYITVLSHT